MVVVVSNPAGACKTVASDLGLGIVFARYSGPKLTNNYVACI